MCPGATALKVGFKNAKFKPNYAQKMRIFWKKAVKSPLRQGLRPRAPFDLRRLGAGLQASALLLPSTTYYNFIPFILNAKCVLTPSKKKTE